MKLASSFFLLASVFVVGCSGEVAEPRVDGVPAPTKLDERGNVAQPGPGVEQAANVGPSFEVGSVVPSEVFVCRKGAFCDDFESSMVPSRWSDRVESGAAVGQGASSASRGKGSLSVSAKPGDESFGFLFLDNGHVASKWSGSLSFAIRVAEIPKKSLGTTELLVKTGAYGEVSLALVVAPEGLFLEQRATAACKRDVCTPKSTLVAPATAGTWMRVELGIEAGGAGASAPFGRVEVRVNAGPLVSTDLTIPIGEGSSFLRAGITAGDVNEATLDLDDVSLLTR